MSSDIWILYNFKILPTFFLFFCFWSIYLGAFCFYSFKCLSYLRVYQSAFICWFRFWVWILLITMLSDSAEMVYWWCCLLACVRIWIRKLDCDWQQNRVFVWFRGVISDPEWASLLLLMYSWKSVVYFSLFGGAVIWKKEKRRRNKKNQRRRRWKDRVMGKKKPKRGKETPKGIRDTCRPLFLLWQSPPNGAIWLNLFPFSGSLPPTLRLSFFVFLYTTSLST